MCSVQGRNNFRWIQKEWFWPETWQCCLIHIKEKGKTNFSLRVGQHWDSSLWDNFKNYLNSFLKSLFYWTGISCTWYVSCSITSIHLKAWPQPTPPRGWLLLPHCLSPLPPLVSHGLGPWGDLQPIRCTPMSPVEVDSGCSQSFSLCMGTRPGGLCDSRGGGRAHSYPAWLGSRVSPSAPAIVPSITSFNFLPPEGPFRADAIHSIAALLSFLPLPSPVETLSLLFLSTYVDRRVGAGQVYPPHIHR